MPSSFAGRQDAANRRAGLASGLAATGVAAAAAVVRRRLGTLPGGRDSAWHGLRPDDGNRGGGLWLVTGAVRAMVGQLVDVMAEPLPSPDVLRTVTALNYALLGLSGMAALGLMILGVVGGGAARPHVGPLVRLVRRGLRGPRARGGAGEDGAYVAGRDLVGAGSRRGALASPSQAR